MKQKTQKLQCDFCKNWFDMKTIVKLELNVQGSLKSTTDDDFDVIDSILQELKNDYNEDNAPQDDLLPWLQEVTLSCKPCAKIAKRKLKNLKGN